MRCANVVVALWIVLGPLARSATADPLLESAVAQSGRDAFLRYCASCHGTDARGDGPAAPSLVTKPSDLTKIAERNGGTFPTDRIAQTIDGRTIVPSHGTRDMPIWGERFGRSADDSSTSEQVVRGQLLMLVVYLQSIQR